MSLTAHDLKQIEKLLQRQLNRMSDEFLIFMFENFATKQDLRNLEERLDAKFVNKEEFQELASSVADLSLRFEKFENYLLPIVDTSVLRLNRIEAHLGLKSFSMP